MTKAKIKSFSDISIGDTASFERLIEIDDLLRFSELSGDYNPLHLDSDYASRTEFGEQVVYGMLLGAWVSRLVGMELPGAKALLLKESMEFKKPAKIGDKLLISGKVTHKSQSGQLVELAINIHRQSDLLAVGSVYVKVLK